MRTKFEGKLGAKLFSECLYVCIKLAPDLRKIRAIFNRYWAGFLQHSVNKLLYTGDPTKAHFNSHYSLSNFPENMKQMLKKTSGIRKINKSFTLQTIYRDINIYIYIYIYINKQIGDTCARVSFLIKLQTSDLQLC